MLNMLMNRIVAFLEDTLDIGKRKGLRAAMRHVKSRVFIRYARLLYEYRRTGGEPLLPEGWSVVVVSSAEDAAGVDLLRRVEGGLELGNFRRNAVAYIMCIDGLPVAHRWHYPRSPLALKLGPGFAYTGAMHVLPAWRGRGIQSRLLMHMASLLPEGTRIVMEIEDENLASRRGVAKAHAVCLGRVHVTVFLGKVVRIRIEPLQTSQAPAQLPTKKGPGTQDLGMDYHRQYARGRACPDHVPDVQ